MTATTWSAALLLALTALLPGVGRADPALSAALARQMEVNRLRYGIAGQALLVMHEGRVLFRGVDGVADAATGEPLTTQHVFPVYSLSKLLASTLVMRRVERRQLDLDTPVGHYLPTLPRSWQAIRVRDFLEHASGVPEYFDAAAAAPPRLPADRASVFAMLADRPLQFTPGTRTRYTQTNYLVLATLLEAVEGTPYDTLVQAEILDPLAMRHTWPGRALAPASATVTSYAGVDGRLLLDPGWAWPAYSHAHADLHLTLDDLARFLAAVSSGALVGQHVMERSWQPRTLADGRAGGFAGGWEHGRSGSYLHVGHDGGARVRVRILYPGRLDRDVYVIAYLTTGSARNVWSRTLVESVMATLAPERFPAEVVSGQLLAHALDGPDAPATHQRAAQVRTGTPLAADELERVANATGYSAWENFGAAPAVRIFELNAVLFPCSANAWDSLAEAQAAQGDTAQSRAAARRSRALAQEPREVAGCGG